MNNVLEFFKFVMELPEYLIGKMEFLPEFVQEALVDSINLLPFLFVIFVLIEIIEQYFTKKRHLFVFFIKKVGPLFGSLFASIPQCGFSVIASTVYTRRLLSRGTLVAVYLATSDEAIPVLLANPSKAYIIIPIILLKIIIAIIAGYLVDIVVKYEAKEPVLEVKNESTEKVIEKEEGCCHHHLANAVHTKDFWFHPLKHTLNIFIFILIISLILGFAIDKVGDSEELAKYCLINSPLQPILMAFVGLIPNCAISVLLSELFIKGTISFGALLSGLCSAGGLGLLVLFKRNGDIKDTLLILAILVIIASCIGLIFQYDILNVTSILKTIGITI